jgi:DNA-binding transcriptional LysR family regulator
LIPEVEQICASVEALFTREPFDAQSMERQFIVAAPDYLVFLLGETLLNILRERAPRVRVRFVDVPYTLVENLASGDLDAAICADVGLWSELHKQHGFMDATVAVVAHGHPLLEQPHPTTADVLQFPQLAFAPGRGRSRESASTSADEFPRTVPNRVLATEQFMVLPFLAVRSNYVARIPRSLAQRMTQLLLLGIVELTEERTQIDTCLFWGPLQERNAAQRWFRTVLMECLTTFSADSAPTSIKGVMPSSPCPSSPATALPRRRT